MREALGLSQEQIAERIGVSLRSWGRYERSEREIPHSVIESLVKEGASRVFLELGAGPQLSADVPIELEDAAVADYARLQVWNRAAATLHESRLEWGAGRLSTAWFLGMIDATLGLSGVLRLKKEIHASISELRGTVKARGEHPLPRERK